MTIHDLAYRSDHVGVASLIAVGAPVDVRRERDGYTPLMCAVSRPHPDPDLIRLLIGCKADVNATTLGIGDDKRVSVLSLALKRSDLTTITALLEAGADARYTTQLGYDALNDAVCNRSWRTQSDIIPLLHELLARGAPAGGRSHYGESALNAMSYRGWFDVVRLLLQAGAPASYLGWTPLMNAIALGKLADVQRELSAGSDLSARDHWKRTPWLLGLQTGDIKKARALLAAGAERAEGGKTANISLKRVIQSQHTSLLRWLLEEGFDPRVTDKHGHSALHDAVWENCAESARLLLAAGATWDFDLDEPLREGKRSLEMIHLLQEAGADLSYAGREVRATLTGLKARGEPDVSRDEYLEGKSRRFGRTNPQRMDIPFWHDMVRCGAGAWEARAIYGDTKGLETGPVWCFNRYGQSFTLLPNGRFVRIGGEHEDWYDADFCIYNDVVVHDTQGGFEIYSYPREVFPPTDFHSATLVDRYIYIIGRAGYANERDSTAPVYRLHCDTWSIEKLETSGTSPGWIYYHHASYDRDHHAICLSGGLILTGNADEVEERDSTITDSQEEQSDLYILDLASLQWQRVQSAL